MPVPTKKTNQIALGDLPPETQAAFKKALTAQTEQMLAMKQDALEKAKAQPRDAESMIQKLFKTIDNFNGYKFISVSHYPALPGSAIASEVKGLGLIQVHREQPILRNGTYMGNPIRDRFIEVVGIDDPENFCPFMIDRFHNLYKDQPVKFSGDVVVDSEDMAEMNAKIIELYDKGMHIADIAKEVGTLQSHVEIIATRHIKAMNEQAEKEEQERKAAEEAEKEKNTDGTGTTAE